MKFWTRLRWICSAAFAALLLWSWWAGDADLSGGHPTARSRPFTF